MKIVHIADDQIIGNFESCCFNFTRTYPLSGCWPLRLLRRQRRISHFNSFHFTHHTVVAAEQSHKRGCYNLVLLKWLVACAKSASNSNQPASLLFTSSYVHVIRYMHFCWCDCNMWVHSSQNQGLCSMKSSSETLQNLLFPFFIPY